MTEPNNTRPLKIISGSANPEFSQKVAQHLNTKLADALIGSFSDGESQIEIREDVRGCDVFVIQPTCPPANHTIMELYFILDALMRSSCWRVTAVIPYYGYGRQDRKIKPRVPISAKAVAKLLESDNRLDRVLTLDLHAGQIQGFFDCPVDHLYGSSVFLDHMKKNIDPNTVLLSPDAGGTDRVVHYSKRLELPMATSYKKRTKPNEIGQLIILGEVKGKHVVVLDDMVDTAGTLRQIAILAMDSGALSVTCYATHPVLSGTAAERIQDSPIKTLYVTDTIPLHPKVDKNHIDCVTNKIEVISVAPLFGQAIKNIHDEQSVSSLFEGFNE